MTARVGAKVRNGYADSVRRKDAPAAWRCFPAGPIVGFIAVFCGVVGVVWLMGTFKLLTSLEFCQRGRGSALFDMMCRLGKSWWMQTIAYLLLDVMRVEIRCYNTEALKWIPDDWNLLVFSNHPSELDWCFLWPLLAAFDRLRSLKIILKDISRVPIFGWACYYFRFVFLCRNDRAADMRTIARNLKKEDRVGLPSTLLIFPEGTDLETGLEKSQEFARKNDKPVWWNVLTPRVTGFKECVSILRKLPRDFVVLDVTMAYEGYRDYLTPGHTFGPANDCPTLLHIDVQRLDVTAAADLEAQTGPYGDNKYLNVAVKRDWVKKVKMSSCTSSTPSSTSTSLQQPPSTHGNKLEQQLKGGSQNKPAVAASGVAPSSTASCAPAPASAKAPEQRHESCSAAPSGARRRSLSGCRKNTSISASGRKKSKNEILSADHVQNVVVSSCSSPQQSTTTDAPALAEEGSAKSLSASGTTVGGGSSCSSSSSTSRSPAAPSSPEVEERSPLVVEGGPAVDHGSKNNNSSSHNCSDSGPFPRDPDYTNGANHGEDDDHEKRSDVEEAFGGTDHLNSSWRLVPIKKTVSTESEKFERLYVKRRLDHCTKMMEKYHRITQSPAKPLSRPLSRPGSPAGVVNASSPAARRSSPTGGKSPANKTRLPIPISPVRRGPFIDHRGGYLRPLNSSQATSASASSRGSFLPWLKSRASKRKEDPVKKISVPDLAGEHFVEACLMASFERKEDMLNGHANGGFKIRAAPELRGAMIKTSDEIMASAAPVVVSSSSSHHQEEDRARTTTNLLPAETMGKNSQRTDHDIQPRHDRESAAAMLEVEAANSRTATTRTDAGAEEVVTSDTEDEDEQDGVSTGLLQRRRRAAMKRATGPAGAFLPERRKSEQLLPRPPCSFLRRLRLYLGWIVFFLVVLELWFSFAYGMLILTTCALVSLAKGYDLWFDRCLLLVCVLSLYVLALQYYTHHWSFDDRAGPCLRLLLLGRRS